MKEKIIICILILIFPGCQQPSKKFVTNFIPITNVIIPDNNKFEVDMDSVIIKGIQVPTKKQVGDGAFIFSFNFDRPDQNKKYYYKIYFQNEEYKFPEKYYNSDTYYVEENFYGAWGPVDFGFKEIPEEAATVIDSFVIVGNPRNEKIYFGESIDTYQIVEDEVEYTINQIKIQPEWLRLVNEKAIKARRSLEEQLRLDAIFTIGLNRNKGEENHRWKRNPRMGRYSAMLVVCSEDDLKKIPEFIHNITLTHNSKFVNPYYYFLHDKGKDLTETNVLIDTNIINLFSRIDISKGIYVNIADQQNPLKFDCLRDDCNKSKEKFASAHVQQFFHGEIKEYILKTIPVISDVLNNEYTINDYKKSERTFKKSQMIVDYIRSSDCPCKTVSVKDDHIEIFNPKSSDLGTARKENVGIKTRIGYTYGKFTAKIKFPSQINSTNVWTGLTNAFWMIYQDNSEWNNRRPSKSGYTPKGSFSPDAPRYPVTTYSEIDFEIVKTSQYWPVVNYPDGEPKTEDAQKTDDVIVTATNFDLCNEDPVRYKGGFSPVKFEGKEYLPFRWEPWYQAVTIRTPVKNNELYEGPFYYFQIEWKPKEIIWRIGPSKEDLRVIAYVNDEITSIPNNQMLMIVSQEYHQSEWWPPMPFKQEFIPFLKNDLIGKIYSLEIE